MLSALLAYAAFPPDAATASRVLAIVLAALGLVLGWLRPTPASLVLVALAPLLPGVPRFFGDATNPPLLLLAGLATVGGALAARLSTGEPPALPRSSFRAAGAFLAVAAASCVASIVRGETLFFLLRGGARPLFVNELGMTAGSRSRDALKTFLLFALLLAALDLFSRVAGLAENRRRLATAAVSGGFVALFLAVLEKPLALPLTLHPWIDIGRRAGTSTDPNAFGVTAALLAPFAVALLVRGRERPSALVPAAGVLVLLPFALEGSGSRSGLLLLLAAALVAAVGLVRLVTSTARRAALVAGFLLAGALAVAVVWKTAPRGGSTTSGGLFSRLGAAASATSLDELATHRTLFWRTAFEMIAQEPMSGIGLAGFPYEFPVFYTRHHSRAVITDNATNALLDLGAECGLPGLVLALLFAVPLLAGASDATFGAAHARRDALSRAAGAALLGLAISSLTGFHLRFVEVGILAALAAAFVVSREARAAESESDDAPAAPRRALAVIAAFGIAASLVAVLPTRAAGEAFRAGPWVGLWGWETPTPSGTHRWLGPRAFRRVLPDEKTVTLVFSNERPDGRPVLVSSDVDGSAARTMSIPAGESKPLVVDGIAPGAQAIRLRFSPTFVPRALVGGGDVRELSVVLASDSGDHE